MFVSVHAGSAPGPLRVGVTGGRHPTLVSARGQPRWRPAGRRGERRGKRARHGLRSRHA